MKRKKMASCPHCGSYVPLDRKQPHEPAITVCCKCYMCFLNDDVESRLEDVSAVLLTPANDIANGSGTE